MENNNQMHEDEKDKDERAVEDKKDKEYEGTIGDKKDKEDEGTIGDKKDKEDEGTIGDKKDKEEEVTVGDEDKKEWYVCNFCMENSPFRRGKVYTQFESKNYWICDECSSTFQTGYKVTNIKESEDGLDSNEESRNTSPFTCDVCGEGFASVESLFEHITKHSVDSVTSGGSTNSPPYLEDESSSTSEDTK